jgi:PST family polysaccharide transporter
MLSINVMDDTTNKYTFFKGIGYTGISYIVSILLAFLFNYIFANYLGVNGYGIFNYALSFITLVSGFTGAYAVDLAITRYISETKSKKLLKELFKKQLLLLVPLFIFILLGSDWIAAILQKDISFTLRQLSLGIFIIPLYTSMKSVLSAFKEFKKIAIIEFLFKILDFVVAILLFFGFGLKISSLVISSIIAYTAGVLISYIYIAKLSYSEANPENQRVGNFIKWSYLPTILKRVYPSIFMLIYGQIISIADIGYFALASKSEIIISVIRGAICGVYYPFVSSFPNDDDKLRKYSNGVLKLYICLAILLAITVLLIGNPVIMYLFPAYEKSYLLMVILSLSYTIDLTLFDSLFLAKEKTAIVAKLSIIRAVTCITAGYILVSLFGVYGVALSYLAIGGVSSIFVLYFLRKIGIKISIIPNKEDIVILKQLLNKIIKRG